MKDKNSMGVLHKPHVYTIDMSAVRSARSSVEAINRIIGNRSRLPTFFHKWMRKTKDYTIPDLRLPGVLFAVGKEVDWGRPVIGVGGTRSPASDTFCQVSRVCSALAQVDINLISGAVPGVDLAAHLSVLNSDRSSTICVMANSAQKMLFGHEWGNVAVNELLLQKGCFLSEYETDVEIWSMEFKERLLSRDRIISGLSDVFLVFECSRNGATVDTARRARLQGKRVLCIESDIVTSDVKSARHGVAQLINEYGFPSVRTDRLSESQIIDEVLNAGGRARSVIS